MMTMNRIFLFKQLVVLSICGLFFSSAWAQSVPMKGKKDDGAHGVGYFNITMDECLELRDRTIHVTFDNNSSDFLMITGLGVTVDPSIPFILDESELFSEYESSPFPIEVEPGESTTIILRRIWDIGGLFTFDLGLNVDYIILGEEENHNISGFLHYNTNCRGNSERLAKETESEANVYPNPVVDFVYLEYALEEETEVEVVLYDLTGRLVRVLSEKNTVSKGSHAFEYNVSELETGNYILALNKGGESEAFQIRK